MDDQLAVIEGSGGGELTPCDRPGRRAAHPAKRSSRTTRRRSTGKRLPRGKQGGWGSSNGDGATRAERTGSQLREAQLHSQSSLAAIAALSPHMSSLVTVCLRRTSTGSPPRKARGKNSSTGRMLTSDPVCGWDQLLVHHNRAQLTYLAALWDQRLQAREMHRRLRS